MTRGRGSRAKGAVRQWDAGSGEQIAVLKDSQWIYSADVSPDERLILVHCWDPTLAMLAPYRLFPQTQQLADDVKSAIPRCLTPAERAYKYFLDPEPPEWCIARSKWPYQTRDWKEWLRFKRTNSAPPLPGAPDWEQWVAVHADHRGVSQ